MIQPNKIETIQGLFQKITHTGPNACYTAALFSIVNSLSNCHFYNELGEVNANLALFYITPSSFYKSPMKEALRDLYRDVWRQQGMIIKSRFTT